MTVLWLGSPSASAYLVHAVEGPADRYREVRAVCGQRLNGADTPRLDLGSRLPQSAPQALLGLEGAAAGEECLTVELLQLLH